jgi:hypothetical protein
MKDFSDFYKNLGEIRVSAYNIFKKIVSNEYHGALSSSTCRRSTRQQIRTPLSD